MPSWGIVDTANNKPVYVSDANVVYGVDVTEESLNKNVPHAGWVQVEYGKGPITAIAVTNGGTGYANAAALSFSGANVYANASATITTNATGGVTSVTVVDGGLFEFAPTITAPTGSGATFSATLGGRAGRIRYETLVATSAITGDDTDDTLFPDS